MTPPSAFARYRILLGLRWRLLLRASGKNSGRAVALGLALVAMTLLGVFWGFGIFDLASKNPDRVAAIAQSIFFVVFVAEVALGVVSLVVAEFFDISRLMHHPIGYPEVFAAMLTSGLIAPVTLLYVSPAVGLGVALGGSLTLQVVRTLSVLLLLLLGHCIALVLNLAFLTFVSRRKLRDLATIVASLIGVGLYLVMRGFGPGRSQFGDLLLTPPSAELRWLPSSWLSEVFLGSLTVSEALPGVLLSLALLSGLILIGAGLLKASFFGQVASPEAKARKGADRREWLKGPSGALARLARRLYLRVPQVKALYIQQTVFLLAPIYFIIFEKSPVNDALAGPFWVVLFTLLLSFSHLVFVQSYFGLDGPGLMQMLLSPVSRARLLFVRSLSLGGFFFAADAVLISLTLGIMGMLRGGGTSLFALFPLALLLLAILILINLAFGAVTSIYWPMRLVSSGRRPIQGQRSENAGCTAQIARLLLFLPAAALASLLAALAMLPTISPLPFGIVVPRGAIFATVPMALGLAVLIYVLAIQAMGRRLEQKEEQLLRALSDTGE